MLRMYIVELELVDCSATLGGMAHSFSEESDRRAIFIHETITRWHLSIVEQAAQKINGLPTPFLSQTLFIHFPTHAHAHTSKSPPFTFLLAFFLFVTCKRKNGCVTFWWRNDDHGSLSSPWRMDLIHSMLVCAYSYSTGRLSWSICRDPWKSICITLLPYARAHSWGYNADTYIHTYKECREHRLYIRDGRSRVGVVTRILKARGVSERTYLFTHVKRHHCST